MKKILIVDTDPAVLTSLSDFLSYRDTAVIVSTAMEEAEVALSRYTFDLVIADIRLSGMEGRAGLEFINYTKRLAPETELIIMHARGPEDLRDAAIRMGALDYYEKPVNIDKMKAMIESFLFATLSFDVHETVYNFREGGITPWIMK